MGEIYDGLWAWDVDGMRGMGISAERAALRGIASRKVYFGEVGNFRSMETSTAERAKVRPGMGSFHENQSVRENRVLL